MDGYLQYYPVPYHPRDTLPISLKMVAGVVRGRRGQPRADDPRRHERALLRHEPPAAVPRQRRPHHPALLATLPLRQHVDLQPDRHLGLPAAGGGTIQLLHTQVRFAKIMKK